RKRRICPTLPAADDRILRLADPRVARPPPGPHDRRATYHALVDVFSAVVTLFLIMVPLGTIPLFLSVLKTVPHERRRLVLGREIALAYVVLVLFLFVGVYLLQFLRLEQEPIGIAGPIVLFLIALRMIFPGNGTAAGAPLEGEPFVVPLAVPLLAGPSTLAAVLLLQRSAPSHTG